MVDTPRSVGTDAAGGTGSAEAPLLEVANLVTAFRTPRGTMRAVDGVSFRLRKGETIGIVGESGSGKSVLAKSIMNLLGSNATTTGSIRFEGRELADLSKEERKHFWGTEIAMVFQDPMTSLNPVRKIGIQLTESMRYHLALSKRDAKVRAEELLSVVGIPAPAKRLDEYPHQLSGGMRQRVTIAIALACRPKLLIADEPTTALDVTIQKQILDLLAGLQDSLSMGMILITHDLGVVAGRTDHIGVMYAGRLVEQADTATLFAHMRHPYAEALLASIPRVELASHTRLSAIAGRPPDLTRPPQGCRFSPRCRYAQPTCLTDDPPLELAEHLGHLVACHFPTGTEAGAAALAANLAASSTAAGLDLTAVAVS